MNQKKFYELLKKYNNGIIRGSKRKLAKELGYDETSISNISLGRAKPSEELIKAMAKVLKVKEDELKKIFDLSNLSNIFEDKNYTIINKNEHLKEKIKFIEEKNKFLEKQIASLEQQISFLQQQLSFYKNKK